MNTSDQTKIQMIANHYGFPHQFNIFIEECAEAIQAAQKYRRNSTIDDLWHLAEEIADVAIMVEQMKHFIGKNTIQKYVTQKLDRQLKRMEVEELC